MNDTTKLKIEVRNVKHTFTPDEKNNLGQRLAQAFGDLHNIEAEFDQVKADYKAKLTKQEADMQMVSTNIVNGFEMRNERCVVVYRPDAGEKDLYLETVVQGAEPTFADAIAAGLIDPVLKEKMTREDFQAELIEAESKFDKRKSVPLFPSVGDDYGELVTGSLGGKWFGAVRIRIAKHKLEERLDSEQKAFKVR